MDDVARIRRFNRNITQHLGVLNSDFLGRNRSIGASRALFEVGERKFGYREVQPFNDEPYAHHWFEKRL